MMKPDPRDLEIKPALVIQHVEVRTPLTHTSPSSSETVVFDGWRSRCQCGAEWTHPAGRPKEEMDSIFESHVRYFHNKTLVL